MYTRVYIRISRICMYMHVYFDKKYQKISKKTLYSKKNIICTTYVYARICMYMHVYDSICMYMHVYVCICMYMHVNMCSDIPNA